MKWLTPEVVGIISFIVLLVVSVVKFIRNWTKNWNDALLAQDRRLEIHDNHLSEHDIELAEITKDIAYIRETAKETHDDVKTLLKQHGGTKTA